MIMKQILEENKALYKKCTALGASPIQVLVAVQIAEKLATAFMDSDINFETFKLSLFVLLSQIEATERAIAQEGANDVTPRGT